MLATHPVPRLQPAGVGGASARDDPDRCCSSSLFATLFVVRVPETVWATFVVGRCAARIRCARCTRAPSTRSTSRTRSRWRTAPCCSSSRRSRSAIGWPSARRSTRGCRAAAAGSDNERQKFDNQARADAQERDRLEQRAANLQRQVTLKEQEAGDRAGHCARARRSFEEGVGTAMEASQKKLDADRAGRRSRAAAERRDRHPQCPGPPGIRDGVAPRRLRRTAARHRRGPVRVPRAEGHARSGSLARRQRDSGRDAVRRDTIVKLHVRSPGAVVHEGDVLADVVCSGDRLEAELMLPERGLALVAPGAQRQAALRRVSVRALRRAVRRRCVG